MSNGLNEEMREIVDMELEAIKAIYLDEIEVRLNDTNDSYLAYIAVDVYPKTGHNTDDQFVKLTLTISVPQNYPNEWPEFDLKNIRGLTEDKIERIKSNIESVCEQRIGETMLYDIIEKTRDLLTSLNHPIGNRCAICLYDFTTNDQILKNQCFHHLHCRCFADYVVSTQSSQSNEDSSDQNNRKRTISLSNIRIQCPVCRIDLKSSDFRGYVDPTKYSVPSLSNQPLKDENHIIEEAKLNVRKFDEIYEKQLKNGGIIDTEVEKYKYFIRISETNDQNVIS